MTRSASAGAALFLVLLTGCDLQETRRPPETVNPRIVTENENLRKRIAEMEEDNELREQYITDVTQTLASVQGSLANLRVAQSELQRQSSTLEQRNTVTMTQRDDLLRRIEALRDEFETNSARLNEARQRAEDAESKVSEFLPLIAQLQTDLAQRDQEVKALRATVANLQVDLRRRDDVIATQTQVLAERDRTVEEQARRIDETEKDRNRVYYRIDTIAALQSRKLIARKGGLFGSRVRGVWLPARKLDVGHFTEADRRDLRSLEISAPAGVTMLVTLHDPESFRLEPLTSRTSILHIEEPERFWAGGPFLIIAKR